MTYTDCERPKMFGRENQLEARRLGRSPGILKSAIMRLEEKRTIILTTAEKSSRAFRSRWPRYYE